MRTRKLLVAYDESKLSARKGDFLAVVFDETVPVFFGLKSRRVYKTGLTVFLGKEIEEKDLFAKLVDSGRKIASVNETLKVLADYIEKIEEFKIGNVVKIAPQVGKTGFGLLKIAEMPRSQPKNLP
jgi:hypothetical protein